MAYLGSRNEAPFRERRLIYERAVRLLPRSYKLWRARGPAPEGGEGFIFLVSVLDARAAGRL